MQEWLRRWAFVAALAAPVLIAASGALAASPELKLEVDNANAFGGTITSSPAGISCGNDCTGSFEEQSTVTLRAVPWYENAFAGFGGACAGTSCVVTMDSAQTVHANFFSFTLDNVALDKRRGTASLGVRTGAHGTLVLAGPEVRTSEATADHASSVSLAVVPTGSARKALERTGVAIVRLRITYTPPGGVAASQPKVIRLLRS
jgi:hypothetical protein